MAGNGNDPDQAEGATFAGTIDLESGKVERVADNPDLVDDPNAVIEPAAGDPPAGDGSAQPANSDPAPVAQPPAAAAATTQSDYLKNWNEKAGTQFQTDDEIIEEIKASRASKEKLTDYEKKLGELSVLDDPFVRDIARAKKAGIGIELYLEAVKMDVDKLEPKQVLREAFFRENLGSNPKLLEQRFEREYRAKYGAIGQKPDVSGLDELEAKIKLDEFNQEQEFLQLSFEDEVRLKRNFMHDWKQKNVTIPDVPQQATMTDAQIQQYTSQVDSFVGQNEKFEIPIGDLKFNFGLKDYKETLKKELLNPIETLKKHGIDIENGTIDAEKLGKLLTANHVVANVAKPLSDWTLDQRNLELLKNKMVQPAPSQPIAAGAPPSDDDIWARMGKGIQAQRQAQSQS